MSRKKKNDACLGSFKVCVYFVAHIYCTNSADMAPFSKRLSVFQFSDPNIHRICNYTIKTLMNGARDQYAFYSLSNGEKVIFFLAFVYIYFK